MKRATSSRPYSTTIKDIADLTRAIVKTESIYRGKAIPELDGQYFFADFCAGFVRSFAIADGKAGEVTDWTPTLGVGAITSFGTDATGELYLTTIEGNLFRIARAK